MRISTTSWPDCVCTSEAYLAGCWGAAMWSIRILIPVSLVKRWPISASFLSEAGAKLFQQRYETWRCWPRAGGTPVARMPARPAVVVKNRRRLIGCMGSCLLVDEDSRRPLDGPRRGEYRRFDRYAFGLPEDDNRGRVRESRVAPGYVSR